MYFILQANQVSMVVAVVIVVVLQLEPITSKRVHMIVIFVCNSLQCMACVCEA